jgi:uncharacterized membrane protein
MSQLQQGYKKGLTQLAGYESRLDNCTRITVAVTYSKDNTIPMMDIRQGSVTAAKLLFTLMAVSIFLWRRSEGILKGSDKI